MKGIKRLLAGILVAILVTTMLPVDILLAAEPKGEEILLVQLGEVVTVEENYETKYYKFVPKSEGYITFYETEGYIDEIGIYDENMNLIRENSGGITGSWSSEVTGYFEKDKVYYVSIDGEGEFSSYKSVVTNGIMEKEVQNGEHFAIIVENSGLYKMNLTNGSAQKKSMYYHLYDVTENKQMSIYESGCVIELKKEHIYKMDICAWNPAEEVDGIYMLYIEYLKESSTAWNGGISVSFSAGSGTEKEPYQITSAQDLALLADEVNKGNNFEDQYFEITADISLNDIGNYNDWGEIPPNNIWITIGTKHRPFSGKFNGNGHTISGMYIDGYTDDLGLFGEITEESIIENVNICNFYIKNSYAALETRMGGIVAANQGTLNNCQSMGVFTAIAESVLRTADINAGNSMGALVGCNEGTIVNCSNVCERTIYQVDNECYWGYNGGAGGIAGRMETGIIANCYNTSQITANVLRAKHGRGNDIGGILGQAESGSIISCWNTGDMEGSIFCGYDSSYIDGGSICMGGLIGTSSSEICNSYNRGNIKSNVSVEENTEVSSKIGGIAGGLSGWSSSNGEESEGKICNCYNVGKMKNAEGDRIEKKTGELTGSLSGNYICCSYWLKSENSGIGSGSSENISDCVSFDNAQRLERETLGAEELCDALNNWFLLGEPDSSSKSLYYRLWENDVENTGYPTLSKNIPKVLMAVEINTLPDKCIYMQGESFDKTGLTLLATYSNGETAVIGEDELEIETYTFSTQGSKIVEVYYNNFTVEIPISVITDSENPVQVEVIALNVNTLHINPGSSYKLTATVIPDNAADKEITWSSSNTNTAIVDGTGNVKAVSGGTATITAASKNGRNASCVVTVPYSITYKLNGGRNVSPNPAYYFGQKVTLKAPTRKSYVFKGWYTAGNYKTRINTIQADTAGNLTLYAKWEKVKTGKAAVKSVKNLSGKKIKVSLKKVSGAKGYEILSSTDRKFKKGRKLLKLKKNTGTITRLKKGRKYFVKARAYKLDSEGKKVYGKYSAVKNVTVRK